MTQPSKKGYRWYAGDQWPDAWKDHHIELFLFGTSKGGEKLQHFKKWVMLLWPEPIFMWDEWCDLFFGACCGDAETIERLTGTKIETDGKWWESCVSTGAASCVSGDTRIYNPITKTTSRIEELFFKGNPSWVMTMHGPAVASAPFIKGVEELFEITLSNGSSFTSTAKHKVLSSEGFLPVCDLRIGTELYAYEQDRQESISGIDQQAQHEDALHCLDKAQDFQSCYHPLSYSCDEPLRLAKEVCLDDLTLQADVLEHIYGKGGERWGGSGNKQGHIHAYRKSFHRSICNDRQQVLKKENAFLFPANSNSREPYPSLFQSCGLSPTRSNHDQPFPKQGHDFYNTPPSTCCGESYFPSENHRVQRKQVQEIKSAGVQVFYDMTVPEYHHYYAEGCIHHNTGKSSKAALWILGEWLCAQAHTSVILTSTSLDQLKRRIWSELCEWISKCKEALPLEIVQSDTEIRYKKGDKKNAIFGIAVKSGGDAQEAVDRIKGIHNRRVFVVIDEMTAVPAAIIAACSNLNKGTLQFQKLGLGNALPSENPHTVQCEPLNDWNSVTVNNEFWLTKKGGCCIHFDGHKSPALRDPKKFHFYINKQQMDADKKEYGGENTPEYWTNDRGFWPPTGLSNTVMDVALLNQFEVDKTAIWKSGWVMCASFDPAFEGGDRRVLQPFKMGQFSNGETGIEFQPPIIVGVDMTQDVRWIHYQIADKVMNLCQNYECDGKKTPILPENFISDTTGEGGGLFSVMSGLWSPKIQSVEFGGAPEKVQISPDRPSTYYEIYRNKVTMLWYILRRYIEGSQVRGLTDTETRNELTKREKKMEGGKTQVLPKSKMKGLGHKSPDKGDASVIAAWFMFKKGVTPAGNTGTAIMFHVEHWNEQADKINLSEEEYDYSDNEGAYV